uniref:Uncharacterized protein n=1 Tax=Anopheles coluzzii TaxID=1518534 RepID=A0A8W7P8K5_ANOCL
LLFLRVSQSVRRLPQPHPGEVSGNYDTGQQLRSVRREHAAVEGAAGDEAAADRRPDVELRHRALHRQPVCRLVAMVLQQQAVRLDDDLLPRQHAGSAANIIRCVRDNAERCAGVVEAGDGPVSCATGDVPNHRQSPTVCQQDRAKSGFREISGSLPARPVILHYSRQWFTYYYCLLVFSCQLPYTAVFHNCLQVSNNYYYLQLSRIKGKCIIGKGFSFNFLRFPRRTSLNIRSTGICLKFLFYLFPCFA